MRIINIVLIILAVALLTGCAQKPVACTLDAKECPDGSFVGRVAPDCEFAPCPEIEEETIKEEEIEEEEPLVGGDKDEHGCIGSAGYTWCEAKQKCLRTWEEPCEEEIEEPEKRYLHTNLQLCKYAEIICEEGETPFFAQDGCGCVVGDPEPDKYFCLETSNEDYACTQEYDPVCGWFDSTKVECVDYPCAEDFSNSCEACRNSNVKYWTEGVCPE